MNSLLLILFLVRSWQRYVLIVITKFV